MVLNYVCCQCMYYQQFHLKLLKYICMLSTYYQCVVSVCTTNGESAGVSPSASIVMSDLKAGKGEQNWLSQHVNSHFLIDQPRESALGAAVELLFFLHWFGTFPSLIWDFHTTIFPSRISFTSDQKIWLYKSPRGGKGKSQTSEGRNPASKQPKQIHI